MCFGTLNRDARCQNIGLVGNAYQFAQRTVL